MGFPDNFARDLRMGFLLNLPVVASVAAYGFVTGVLSRQADMALWHVAAMSGFMFSGTAQLVLVGFWTTNVGVVAALLAVAAISVRYVLIAATCAPLFKPYPPLWRYIMVSVVADENWGVAMAHPDKNRIGGALLFGGGLALWSSWMPASLLGWYFGSAFTDPAAFGLDFAFTAVFLALIIIMAKDSNDKPLIPILVAALTAIATERLVGGSWPIIAGGVAGASAAALAHTEPENLPQ